MNLTIHLFTTEKIIGLSLVPNISQESLQKKTNRKKLLKQESKLYKLLFNFLDKRFLTKRAFLDFKRKVF